MTAMHFPENCCASVVMPPITRLRCWAVFRPRRGVVGRSPRERLRNVRELSPNFGKCHAFAATKMSFAQSRRQAQRQFPPFDKRLRGLACARSRSLAMTASNPGLQGHDLPPLPEPFLVHSRRCPCGPAVVIRRSSPFRHVGSGKDALCFPVLSSAIIPFLLSWKNFSLARVTFPMSACGQLPPPYSSYALV